MNDIATEHSVIECREASPGSRHMRLDIILIVLVLLGLSLRFVGLEQSPPGFFLDEAHHATVSVCLAEQGTDADGHFLPLFAEDLSGGECGAPFAYPQAVWSEIFGKGVPLIAASGVV